MSLAPARGARIPRATYRVQLHREFRFADAAAIVPYLASLGVSHLYTSPFLRARPGSTHGYDVVDHDEINPEIGTPGELDTLLTTLRAHGMGLVLDLVPNHMGVLRADNPRWLDVLEHGEASAHAHFFDIDWTPAHGATEGQVLVPVLGEHYGVVLERGEIALRFDAAQGALSLWYFEHRLPIRPAEYPRVLLLADLGLLAAQAGADSADELRAIADLFAAVPMHADDTRGSPGALAAAAKARLAALVERAPQVAACIDGNVATLNGTPGDAASFDALHALITGQAYRLAFWRVAADDINYRRFFDINDLAAVRQEREEVFAATHHRILDLVARGGVEGLRIDHPDGLADPGAYFARLQDAAGAALGPHDAGARPIYMTIEKILAAHERLPAWPVHGDTGYRFMNAVTALFVDAGAASRFARLYAAFTGERRTFDEIVRRAKALTAIHALASDLNRLTDLLLRIMKLDRRTCDFTGNALRRALVDLAAAFPVYRSYAGTLGAGPDDARHVDWATGLARRGSRQDEDTVFDAIAAILRNDATAPAVDVALRAAFVRRFQQFTAPTMAKGFEDTALYQYVRLACLNEVGGDPRIFGTSVAAFHRANAERARDWPHAMLATSTHDSKRGEDVRARLAALSEMPAAWRLALRRWRQLNRRHRTVVDGDVAPSANDEYLLYQTLLGAWPAQDEPDLDAFRLRIKAYMQKAAREAKQRTSWVNVDAAYERALTGFIDGVLAGRDGNAFIADFLPLQRRLAAAGCINSLAQVTLKLTTPGMPDLYQGCEGWDLNLVDPDNRRPVDYAWRARVLAECTAGVHDPGLASDLLACWQDGRVKVFVTSRLLDLRRRLAELFEHGTYVPLRVQGVHRDAVCAYLRRHEGTDVLVVVPRLWQEVTGDPMAWPVGEAWRDTRILLPDTRHWTPVLGDAPRAPAGVPGPAPAPESLRGNGLPVAELLGRFPVAVLVGAAFPP